MRKTRTADKRSRGTVPTELDEVVGLLRRRWESRRAELMARNARLRAELERRKGSACTK